MKRVLLLAGWMVTGAAPWAAEPIEPLDADFLDYLANMEGDDDDWTLLEEADADSTSLDSESDGQGNKPAARKPSQEAAKPAVEQR